MGKPRSQWYVGVLPRENGQHYSHMEAFRFVGAPTEEKTPRYSYVIGPFRSGRAAKLCASLPGSTMQTVSEWERFAKVTNGVVVGGEVGV
jgi:hypothetical protein